MITAIREICIRLLATWGLLWLPFGVWNSYFTQYKLPFSWLLAGLGLVLVYVVQATLRNTRKFAHHFVQQNITFSVEVGDIFSYEDGMVVSFSDTFDTALGGELISETSVQGLFTKEVYGGDVGALDQDIHQTLQHNRITPVSRDGAKHAGKQDRYPLGTVLHVKKDGKHHYLLALAEMSRVGRAWSNQEIFNKALYNLWNSIDTTAEDKTVSVPILGTGKSRLYSHPELAIKTIIMSAYGYSCLTGRPTAKLRFVVSKQDARHLDMLKLKEFVSSLDAREA